MTDQIERHIDFAVFSALLEESKFWTEDYKPISAPAFYKRGYEGKHGEKYFFGNTQTNKAMVVWGGHCLEIFRDNGKHDTDMLAYALKIGGKFTRLDLAVTDYICEDFLLVDDVRAWYEKSLIESPLAAFGAKFISGYDEDLKPETQTFYIGDMKGRGKKGIFRAYDKSLDLGIGNQIITRIEIELRGEKAHNNARRIAETNDISGNFRASFNVKSADFERLMDAPAIIPQRGQGLRKRDETEKMDARWEWLMKQVAPSLEEAREYDISEGMGNNRMYWFLRAAGMSANAVRECLAKFDKED
jgi:DNA relaxase NicK